MATSNRFGADGFPSPHMPGATGTFTVTAEDRYGRALPNYTGTVHFSSTDPQAVLPPDYTFVPADAGTHTFNVTLKTAGSYAGRSLTATDISRAGITGTQTGIVVNPGAATTTSA